MRRLLVLRPRPGADATARRARAIGLSPVIAPLFAVRQIDWHPPDPADFDAVLMTSANAARHGGQELFRYFKLPLFAVGNATAQAALDAGFAKVVVGRGDGAAVVALAVARRRKRLLHLTGREHVEFDGGEASIEQRVVYASEAVDGLPSAAADALRAGAVALLHSARAARLFGRLVDAAGLDRRGIMLAGLSEAVVVAAGTGWSATAAAPVPDDEALLAIAAGLCDQGANGPE
jgi:uroporphyrinogen-III synthase